MNRCSCRWPSSWGTSNTWSNNFNRRSRSCSRMRKWASSKFVKRTILCKVRTHKPAEMARPVHSCSSSNRCINKRSRRLIKISQKTIFRKRSWMKLKIYSNRILRVPPNLGIHSLPLTSVVWAPVVPMLSTTRLIRCSLTSMTTSKKLSWSEPDDYLIIFWQSSRSNFSLLTSLYTKIK